MGGVEHAGCVFVESVVLPYLFGVFDDADPICEVAETRGAEGPDFVLYAWVEAICRMSLHVASRAKILEGLRAGEAFEVGVDDTESISKR